MHVPSDSFNGRSPEKHAALMLENLFTFAACKIALAQMQGDGRGDLGSFGGSQYVVLKEFMGENPLGGGVNAEEWLEKLLRVDRGLGLRIIETRYAYASKDYEWDQMRRVALSNMETGNIGVLRWVLNSNDVHAVAVYSSALTLSLALRASLVRQEHAGEGGVRRGRGVIHRSIESKACWRGRLMSRRRAETFGKNTFFLNGLNTPADTQLYKAQHGCAQGDSVDEKPRIPRTEIQNRTIR